DSLRHLSVLLSLFFSCYLAHLDLHSFPTRRSSDLSRTWHGAAKANGPRRPACGWPRSICRKAGSRNAFAAASRPGKSRRFPMSRSEEHTSELQSRRDLVCRLLLEKKKKINTNIHIA